MRPQPYYARLSFLAFMLLMVGRYFPAEPWHTLLQCAGAGSLIWAIALMYLRKTGRSNWDGPNWGRRFQAWPGSKPILAIITGLCASMIPILFLLNRRLGLGDGQLAFLCGVLLGLSIVALKFRTSGSACCLLEKTPTTQQ